MTGKEFLMAFVMKQHALGFLFTNAPEAVYAPVIDDFLAECQLNADASISELETELIEAGDYLNRNDRLEERIAALEAVISRIAVQVGHPPIAPGEGGLESVAEAVERHVAYAREREEALDSITPENLQAFAASEAHHDEHHEREATLEAENKTLEALRAAAAQSWAEASNLALRLEAENEALKAAAEDLSAAYQLELAHAAERTREIETLKARAEEAEKYNMFNGQYEEYVTGEAFNAMEWLIQEQARADAAEMRIAKDAELVKTALADAESAQAEAARLRETLGVYADATNWIGYPNNRLWRTDAPGYKLAQAALQPGKKEGE